MSPGARQKRSLQLKLTVGKALLDDAVAQAARALPQSPVPPVLAGMRLHAADGAVEVSAFDYESSARGRVPGDVGEPGTALVPGRLLAEIVRSMPGPVVELAADGTRMTLVSGTARFTLLQLPAQDYPDLPQMPALSGTAGSHAFGAAVAQVAVATGKDHTLPALTGVRTEIDGDQITLIATDRYRLAIRQLAWTPAQDGMQAEVLIPVRALTDVARLAAPAAEVAIHIGASEGFAGDPGIAGFEAGSWQATTRLLAGEYPQVRKLIPAEFSCTAEVPAGAFIQAIKRVALVAERNTPVRLAFTKGCVRLEASTGDQAEASEELDIGFDDADFQVAFNPAYLTDGLAAAGADTVRISMTTPKRPAVITAADGDAGYQYLLMPVGSAG